MSSIRSFLRVFRGLRTKDLDALREFKRDLSEVRVEREFRNLVRALRVKVNGMMSWHFELQGLRDLRESKRICRRYSDEEFSLFEFERQRIFKVAEAHNLFAVDSSEYVDEHENFTNLNIGADHPGREEHGYFEVNGGDFILRSQTTASHFKEKLYERDVSGIMSFGKVYRNDRDSTHLTAFHQVEILIKRRMSVMEFTSLIRSFLESFFQRDVSVKVRPSYFPFTYLSFELDVTINSKTYEIAGAGMMMPDVLERGGISGREIWPAMAFGFERLMMIKYSLSDIKHCYRVFKLEHAV